MSNVVYNEIANAKISETRSIVISECSKGGYTVAQLLAAVEDGSKTHVFMKGAFHVADLNGLYNMRDALNMAIHNIENGVHEVPSEEEEWDNDDCPDDCF